MKRSKKYRKEPKNETSEKGLKTGIRARTQGVPKTIIFDIKGIK
jgi:hypothetical protein